MAMLVITRWYPNFFEPAGPAKGLDSFEVSRRPNWAAMTAFAFFKVFGGM